MVMAVSECPMRLSFNDLDGLLLLLADRLFAGVIDYELYVIEWERLVEFAGWTEQQYLEEIDRRWTGTSDRSPVVFLC